MELTERERIILNFAWAFKSQRDARVIELAQIKTGDVENFANELTDEERRFNREFVEYLMDNKLYV